MLTRILPTATLTIAICCSKPAIAQAVDNVSSPPALVEKSREVIRSTPVSKTVQLAILNLLLKSDELKLRGDYQEALEKLEEAQRLCKDFSAENHYLSKAVQSSLAIHYWFAALSDEDRARYHSAAEPIERSGLLLESNKDLTDEMLAEADQNIVQAIAILRSLHSPHSNDLWKLYNIRRNIADRRRDPRQLLYNALACYEIRLGTLGADSPQTASCLLRLGLAYRKNGDLFESSKAIRSSYRTLLAIGFQTEDEKCAVLNSLEFDLELLGEYAEAKRCIEELDRAYQPKSRLLDKTFTILAARCRIWDLEGNYDPIVEEIDKFQASETGARDETNAPALNAKVLKGRALLHLGKTELAMELIEPAYKKSSKDDSSIYSVILLPTSYAQLLLAQNKPVEAVTVLENCITKFEAESCPNHCIIREPLQEYAKALRQLGRIDDAERIESRLKEIQDSVERMRKQIDDDPDCVLPWNLILVDK